MTLMARDYVTRVRDTLFDPTPGAGWSDDELMRYLNGALTAISVQKPNARTVSADVDLIPGNLQTLPDGGIMLMDAYLNTDRNAVTLQAMHEQARVRDDWATQAAGPTEFVFYDVRVPRRYNVYPKAGDADTLHIIYGKIPDEVTALFNVVDLSDIYENPIWAFMCARAFMKNGPRKDAAAAKDFFAIYKDALAGIAAGEKLMGGLVDLAGEG